MRGITTLDIISAYFWLTQFSVFVTVRSSKSSVCLRSKSAGSGKFTSFPETSAVMLGISSFQMGSEPPVAIPGDGETPLRVEEIMKSFWIDVTEVTVEKFAQFVRDTNYTTTAEHYGNSFVFWMADQDMSPEDLSNFQRQGPGPWWWSSKDGANWKSSDNLYEKNLPNLPVNHVSWDDAVAYCTWTGGRLPSEIEWEFACRGGLENNLFPWGNTLKLNKSHMTNIWQGAFPRTNTEKDGFVLRAPVRSFPCNAYGIFDVAGNVWEWVEGDWAAKSTQYYNRDVRVQKGGSFLCHRKHCYRYRCSARTKATRDSTSSNVGFRCAYDV